MTALAVAVVLVHSVCLQVHNSTGLHARGAMGDLAEYR